MALNEKARLPEKEIAGSPAYKTGADSWNFSANADNDNADDSISDEKVLKAARLLVARHTPQTPIELTAFDTPHNALAEISLKLEELGISHAVSNSLIASLKGYVLENGGSFARAANAKPISIYMAVRNTLPPRRFESGVTEVAFIGQKMAKVEGASSINVRLTATGTAMTSNAADVDAMFANVNETGLWLRFEAPTKEDMEGLMSAMDASLASTVQAVGGAMDANDLKKLLETLQKEDALLPQVKDLIANLIALQEALNGKSALPAAEIPAIVAKISDTLSNPDHVGLIPPTFAQAVLATIQSLSSHPVMSPIMAENGFGHLADAEQERIQLSVIETSLDSLREILSTTEQDTSHAQAIAELIADITSKIDGGNIPHLEVIETIKTKVESISLEGVPAEIKAILQTVTTEANNVLPSTASVTGFESDLSIQSANILDVISEIALKIDSGELSKADLPEGMKEIFEQILAVKETEKEIGLEATIAEIVRVLEGNAPTDFANKIESIVIAITRPELQAAIPADLSQVVQSFVRNNPQVIETVATHIIVRDLVEKAKAFPENSPEAEQIKAAIETVKAEGLSAAILKTDMQVELPQSVQTFLKANPSVTEAVATQAVVRDLAEQVKTLPVNSREAEQIKTLIENVKADGLSAVILKPELQAQLPPSVQVFLRENPSVIEAVATQAVVRDLVQQVQSLPANTPEAAQIKAIIETVKTDGLSAVILKPELQAQLPSSVQAFLKETPSGVEDVKTKTLIRELTEQVKLSPAASPEAQKVNSIIEMIKYDGFSAAIAVPENKAVILKIAAASAIAQVNVQTTAATHSPEAIRNNLDKSYQTQNTAQNSTSVKEMFSPTGATTTVTPKQYSEPVQDRTIRQESTTPATEDKTVAQATGIKSNSTSVKPETSPHPNLSQQKENAIPVVGDKNPPRAASDTSSQVSQAIRSEQVRKITTSFTELKKALPPFMGGTAAVKAIPVLLTQDQNELTQLVKTSGSNLKANDVLPVLQKLQQAQNDVKDAPAKETITKLQGEIKALVVDPKNLPQKIDVVQKPSGPCGEFCRCAEKGAMKQSTNAIQDPAVVHRQVGTGSITIEAKQDGGMTIARTGSDGIVKHQTFSQEVILQSSNEATAAVSLFKERGLDTRNISNDVLLSALNVKSFRHWPRLRLIGEEVIVGQEGWIFGQRFNHSSESIKFLTKEEAIIGTLAGLDIKAKLSDPGHIAKQILERLGGMWGVYLLADIEIIKLLNKMAVAVRRRKNEDNTDEEHFENWSAPTKTWEMLLAKNSKSRRGPKLEDYTKRNVITLGLETCCPQCQGKNWHGLDAVDYQIICERCLNHYDFPQANDKTREWKYRVIGPFSVPDYARGSYSALLTLRALDCVGLRSSRGDTTFCTAMDFEFDGTKCEVDFVALRGRGTIRDYSPPPELIIGETKSLGSGDLIKKSDITKLRRIAKKLPGAIFVISVMRDKFTDTEKKIIKPFVQWGRRADKDGRCMNPVILLTAHELFVDHLIGADWKKLGELYTKYTDYEHTKDLYSFAQATQAIHLGLPSFFTARNAKRKARAKKKG